MQEKYPTVKEHLYRAAKNLNLLSLLEHHHNQKWEKWKLNDSIKRRDLENYATLWC